MANLFVNNMTPTEIVSTYNPDQIRGQVSRNLFGQLPAFGGGPMGGANMGGAAVGMGLGYGLAGLMGAQPPEAQRLQNIQNMGQNLMQEMEIGKEITADEQLKFINQFAARLMKAGYTNEAFKMLSMVKDMGGGSVMLGGFKDKKQLLDAEKSFRGEAEKALGPDRLGIQFYNDTANIKDGDVTKWRGTDDFVAIRNLIKQSLPN